MAGEHGETADVTERGAVDERKRRPASEQRGEETRKDAHESARSARLETNDVSRAARCRRVADDADERDGYAARAEGAGEHERGELVAPDAIELGSQEAHPAERTSGAGAPIYCGDGHCSAGRSVDPTRLAGENTAGRSSWHRNCPSWKRSGDGRRWRSGRARTLRSRAADSPPGRAWFDLPTVHTCSDQSRAEA